jgi:hypothetical protein
MNEYLFLDEWGYPIPNPRVGIDIPTWQQVEQFARDTAHQYLPQVDTEKAKRYAQQLKQAASKAMPASPSFSLPRIPNVNLSPNINLPNIGDPGAWFGQTPQKVSDAADAASRAAEAATAAAKEHEETMRIVKYAVIGVGALGGLALLWSIVK